MTTQIGFQDNVRREYRQHIQDINDNTDREMIYNSTKDNIYRAREQFSCCKAHKQRALKTTQTGEMDGCLQKTTYIGKIELIDNIYRADFLATTHTGIGQHRQGIFI